MSRKSEYATQNAIELTGVTMTPTASGDDFLEAEVSTRLGKARLALDLSSVDRVALKAILPSGRAFDGAIDSWADDEVDHDTEEGRSSVLKLATAFVIQCFEHEARSVN